jgi:hypothetical protein
MWKLIKESIKAFFSDWKWTGSTGCTGTTGCTGYTGISLNE